ncbi:DedA family protein [Streptantibioticus rubrisoli]|uniref:VTT domain-containing protein n=1 Tax=Streptantibioticus rubrisoli TaxID=1387313 RepID=A0ABT1PGT3_9ACTN|nr:VTT domain-containing protein [Streptantibioticus rubrisoli]MCQ4044569.1 VTT domain-containing protein [Streptantibioticus rubrisoli]
MSASSVVAALDSLDFTSAPSQHLAGNTPWGYVLLALTTAPPLVPNSALLVTGGILAADGRLNISLVLLVVAGSALAGDLVIHRTGRAVSDRVRARLHRRRSRGQLLEWAVGRIQRYGIPFVIGCRFLPSGRVTGGLAAGIVRYPARRFLIGASLAEALWATYSVGIGYVGGQATGNSLYAMGLGLGVSLAVAILGGLVQFAARRHARSAPGAEPPTAPDGPQPARAPALEETAPDVASG